MSEHRATIRWNRGVAQFSYETYSRDHSWEFDNGVRLEASATQEFRGTPERVDPEEAYVAAISSCHMLTFLAIAAHRKWIVDSYTDSAIGYLEKNAEGKLAVTRVILQPDVRFDARNLPSADEIAKVHRLAHKECFIANSVHTDISVEIQ